VIKIRITQINFKSTGIDRDTTVKLLGYASVTFDNFLILNNIKLFRRKDDTVSISIPNKKQFTIKNSNTSQSKSIHPISNEAKRHIEIAVLSFYNRMFGMTKDIGKLNYEN